MVFLGALVNRFNLHFISTCSRIYAFKEVYIEILSNCSLTEKAFIGLRLKQMSHLWPGNILACTGFSVNILISWCKAFAGPQLSQFGFLLFLFFWFFGSCSLNPLHLCPVILRGGFGLLLRYYANIMQKRPGDIIN